MEDRNVFLRLTLRYPKRQEGAFLTAVKREENCQTINAYEIVFWMILTIVSDLSSNNELFLLCRLKSELSTQTFFL